MAATAMDLKLSPELKSESVKVNDVYLRYVRAGEGPPVLLLHGFPQDWSEYQVVMPRLARRFTTIAIDLRGIGGSTSGDGYAAVTLAEDVQQLVTTLGLPRVYVVGHGLGGMVAYAFARRYPTLTRGAMILDSCIPGLGGWDEMQADPTHWHVRFMQVPGLAEKLVEGRQADFFDYFFSFGRFQPEAIERYRAAYGSAAQLRAAFEMYRALPANAHFNQMQRGPSNVPISLGAGEKSPFAKLLPKMVDSLREMGFARVQSTLIPGALHYLFEDQPDAMADLIEAHA